MKKFNHVFLICIFLAIFYTGCQSFEPVILPNQPDECNDFYSILKYYSVEGKDSAFVGTVYTECRKARQEKYKSRINELCLKLYPDNIKQFNDCIK